jgi:hypothetical protein
MDPFIEGNLWTTFHSQMAAEIARQLTPQVAPRYEAHAETRDIYDTGEDLEALIESPDPGVSVLDDGRTPLEIPTGLPERVPHYWVEIREPENRRLLTLIEILSPANKRGEARQDYLEKRNSVLRSSANLLEIDLVRQGRRLPAGRPLPDAAYFVFLSRAARRPRMQIWPIPLDRVLPPVPVPLLNDDRDLQLDLQAAFNQVYDVSRYDLLLDYTKAPEVAVPGSATEWLRKVLRSR